MKETQRIRKQNKRDKKRRASAYLQWSRGLCPSLKRETQEIPLYGFGWIGSQCFPFLTSSGPEERLSSRLGVRTHRSPAGSAFHCSLRVWVRGRRVKELEYDSLFRRESLLLLGGVRFHSPGEKCPPTLPTGLGEIAFQVFFGGKLASQLTGFPLATFGCFAPLSTSSTGTRQRHLLLQVALSQRWHVSPQARASCQQAFRRQNQANRRLLRRCEA